MVANNFYFNNNFDISFNFAFTYDFDVNFVFSANHDIEESGFRKFYQYFMLLKLFSQP